MSKVGFGGLGIMGTPMASRLLAAGHEVFAYDQKPVPPRSLVRPKPWSNSIESFHHRTVPGR
jgi:3-hydroxyisobutyrate dehydrogenase-like beta-hydroxyacid dehydrogenase